jgi:hypothetical protein
MKRIVEVAFAVAFVVGVLVSSAENTTLAQVGQLYDTPLFSVQYPTGAQVNLKDDRDQGDDSVTHFYRGRLPHHSWADVDVTEFSGAVLAEDHTEVMFSKSSAKMFDPGFQASPITKTTLGGLEGYKQTVRGHFSSNGLELPLVLRWRLAVSHNRTRVWILQTTRCEQGKSNPNVEEAICEEAIHGSDNKVI